MKPTIGVEILQGKSVVLLVREEADHSPSAKWNRSLAQGQGRAADLPVLHARKDILDRGYAHLRRGTSALLKLQSVAFDRESPAGIIRRALKTQDMSCFNDRSWAFRSA